MESIWDSGARPPSGAVFRALAENNGGTRKVSECLRKARPSNGWTRGRVQQRPGRAWSPSGASERIVALLKIGAHSATAKTQVRLEVKMAGSYPRCASGGGSLNTLSSLSQQNHSHLRESPFPQSKRFDPEESLSRLLALSFSMTYTNAVAWHTTCKSVL